MSDWTRICRLADLPLGERRVAYVDGARVALFHLPEGLYAIEDVCTHDGGELASGQLDGCLITCPRHGARFDVRTGEVAAPPAYEPVYCLETRVADGWVEARDTRW